MISTVEVLWNAFVIKLPATSCSGNPDSTTERVQKTPVGKNLDVTFRKIFGVNYQVQNSGTNIASSKGLIQDGHISVFVTSRK